MKPQVLDSVFTPFSQGESFLTRQHPGSGLGLSICKKLIDLMCGELRVESTPGIGTSCNFSVPVRRVAVSTTSEHMSQSAYKSPTTVLRPSAKSCANILVAEDSGVNQKVLVKVLQKLGFSPSHIHLVDNGLQVCSVTVFLCVLEHETRLLYAARCTIVRIGANSILQSLVDDVVLKLSLKLTVGL
jgi:Histidine kinase-, DNA gyrase B-, and HSP90-like ATPase